MRHVPDEIQTANLLAITSELLSKASIIKLPEGVKYSYQDMLNVILHAATSTSNSLESASNDLKLKSPNSKVLSSDRIHEYINSNTVDYILSSFRKINSEIIDLDNLKDTYHDIAIDFHDIPYYGDKNTQGIRGIKPKNGTSWGFSFCSMDIIGETKLTIDVIDIGGLTKNYAILIESLMNRINSMGIFVKTLFMDREFFNFPVISTLHMQNKQYVIAAVSNKKINRMLNEHKKKFGSTSTILEYQFEKGGPKFNIVAILNPNYDPSVKKEKGNSEYFLFATNIHVNSSSEIIKKIPEEYRKRWNIETGYRAKNAFKIRTCSKSAVVRALFFLIQCILYNVLNLLKSVLEIDAYKLKSAISEAIITYVRKGYKFLYTISIKMFMKIILGYNENRIESFRSRLRAI